VSDNNEEQKEPDDPHYVVTGHGIVAGLTFKMSKRRKDGKVGSEAELFYGYVGDSKDEIERQPMRPAMRFANEESAKSLANVVCMAGQPAAAIPLKELDKVRKDLGI